MCEFFDQKGTTIVSKLARNSEFKTLLADLINPNKKEMNSLKTSVEKLEGEVFELKKENDKLREGNQAKDNRIANLEWHAAQDRLHHIELDQNNHKNSILISGIPERKKEEGSTTSTPEDTNKVVLDMASEKLGIDLTEQDIDHSHRSKNALPGRKRGAPRPIYVKFTKYSTRKKVMMARKKLKDTGMGLHDSLVYGRAQLLRQAQGLVNTYEKVKACWTWDGNVYVLLENGEQDSKILVKSVYDLKEIAKKFSTQKDDADKL